MKTTKTTHKCLQCLAFLFSTIIAGSAVAQSNSWLVVGRDLDYNALQKTVVVNGTNQIHRITVLSAGLNYTNPATGQLVPSSQQISIQPDGTAAATQGQTTVKFPADIYNGVLQVTTPPPNRRNLYSRPLCVTYDDGSNTVVIAVLTNSIGCLTASNQMTYPNCFVGNDGRPIGDLVCDYKLNGFECSLVVHARLPDPGQLGLDPSFCTLELVTEFFSTQDPQQIPAGSDDWFGLQDNTLKFGGLTMTHGKAFAFGNANTNAQPLAAPKSDEGGSTPVYKSWIHTDDGRTFLVEQVPLANVANALAALPLTASIQQPGSGSQYFASLTAENEDRKAESGPNLGLAKAEKRKSWYFVSIHPTFPPSHGILADTNRILLASADFRQKPGVVLDYVELDSGTLGDFTFAAGITYLIANPVAFGGNVTMQSGSCIKYAYGTSIELDGTLTPPSATDPPAVCTAADDDSVGESLNGVWGGYTGAIQPVGGTDGYGNPAFYVPVDPGWSGWPEYSGNAISLNFENVRIRYAATAVSLSYETFANFSDSQITGCGQLAILNDGGLAEQIGQGGVSVTCNNCLLASNNCLIIDNTYYGQGCSFVNCTIDNCQSFSFWNSPAGGMYGNLSAYNCVFSSSGEYYEDFTQGISGDYNGFYNCPPWITGPSCSFGAHQWIATDSPFTTAADANYYLTPDNPFHGKGTTAIDPGLLADLQSKTTYAPQDGGQLDTSGTDLGYHYSVNEDSDYDGIPDWWIWKWLGNYAYSGTNIDAYGNTFYYDYTNGFDPNVIQFSVTAANHYVNTSAPTVQVNVTAGVPYYYAVLVDSTNFSIASWAAYTSSSLTVNLGANEGWHYVWVGLKGLAASTSLQWERIRLKLDHTPPALNITSPLSSTVQQPMIQLQGWSPEDLSSFSFDVANAAGLLANQRVLVLNRYYDTNNCEFTTNTFQGFDIPLTNGINTITLHATDRAGNATTASLSYTLDYTGKTPPALTLYWPQDGAQVSGSSFTWRGHVDDPTANLVAQVVNSVGTTNINAIVERDGDFWAENLPLASGANNLTLTTVDAAGNTSTAAITVYQSDVSLTMDEVSPDQLWNSTVTISGSISDSSDYAVWVNGVMANYTGGGAWEADNVPTTPGGTAVFEARAIPNTDHGGNGAGGNGGTSASYANMGNPWSAQARDAETQTNKPARIYVDHYHEDQTDNSHQVRESWYPSGDLFSWIDYLDNYHESYDWADQQGGNGGSQEPYNYQTRHDLWPFYDNENGYTDQTFTWMASLWPDIVWSNRQYTYYRDDTDKNTIYGPITVNATNAYLPPILEESCYLADSLDASVSSGAAGGWSTHGEHNLNFSRTAQTTMKLFTGGKSGSQEQHLFALYARALAGADKLDPYWIWTGYFNLDAWMEVPSTNIVILNSNLDEEGYRWVVLPDNVTIDVTPNVPGTNYFTFWEDADKEHSVSLSIGGGPSDPISDQQAIIPVNDGDANNDSVPDWADGIDIFGKTILDGGGQPWSRPFTVLNWSVPGGIDITKAKIQLIYNASDPNSIGRTQLPNGAYVYRPAAGVLRIWDADGDQFRFKERIDQVVDTIGSGPSAYQVMGNYVAPNVVYDATNVPQTLFLEGIQPSSAPLDQTIMIQIDPDGQSGFISFATVQVTVDQVDLDVDSDNTDGCNVPDRSRYQDSIRNLPNKPGKILLVNDGDTDGDGIEGFADGFNLSGDGNSANPDYLSTNDVFVPVVLQLSPAIDLTKAQLRLTYSSSDPAGVTESAGPPVQWTAAPGNLRLWKQPANVHRDFHAANDPGHPGDFLPGQGGVVYTAAQLGFTSSHLLVTNYLEGIQPSGSLGDQKIQVEIDPRGDGNWLLTDTIEATVIDPRLEVDGDRDGQITGNPSDDTCPTKPYRFWINDSIEGTDDDESADDQIPGQSEFTTIDGKLYPYANYAEIQINGRSDFVNYFPIAISLGNTLQLLPTTAGFEYHLSQADSAVEIVNTSLSQNTAFAYLTDTTSTTGYGTGAQQPPDSASLYQCQWPGNFWNDITIDSATLNQIQNNNGVWVVLAEGCASTTNSLNLDIWNNGRKLISVPLYLSISGVEQMFRHYNMCAYANGTVDVPSRYNAPNEPATTSKNFAFLHGYNVNQQEARGVESEVFKRLFWSRSKAKFYGVTWNGAVSKEAVPLGLFTPNYHTNVVNALLTAPHLADFLNGLSGDTTVAAHSLGNMVVLSAISDFQAAPQNYFMIDAAVPMEAIQTGMTLDPSMVYSQWQQDSTGSSYDPRLYASDWWQLFPSGDKRSTLTWSNRLGNLQNVDIYNFFSAGEEVLRRYPKDPETTITTTIALELWYASKGIPFGTYAWVWQEKGKGTYTSDTFVGSMHGGWSFNLYYYTYYNDGAPPTKMTASDAALLPNSELQTNAFFDLTSEFNGFGTDTTDLALYGPGGSAYAQANRDRILSDAIPALTLPVGANYVDVFNYAGDGSGRQDQNIDMQANFETGWPAARFTSGEKNNNWHHSDFGYVAYPFTHELFDKIVGAGGLK